MSIEFQSGEYLEVDSAVVTGSPLAFSAWVYPLNATGFQFPISLVDKDSASDYCWMDLNGAGSDEARFICNDAVSGISVASTTNAFTANAWNHMYGEWTSSSATLIILNGDTANQGTDNPGFASGSAFDRTSIGRLGDLSPTNTSGGYFAEVAVWNKVQPGGVRAALNAGFSPLHWTDGLVLFRDLIRGAGAASANRPYIGPSMTEAGTPVDRVHPPIIYPAPPIVLSFAAAVGGAAALPRSPFSGHAFSGPFGGPFG